MDLIKTILATPTSNNGGKLHLDHLHRNGSRPFWATPNGCLQCYKGSHEPLHGVSHVWEGRRWSPHWSQGCVSSRRINETNFNQKTTQFAGVLHREDDAELWCHARARACRQQKPQKRCGRRWRTMTRTSWGTCRTAWGRSKLTTYAKWRARRRCECDRQEIHRGDEGGVFVRRLVLLHPGRSRPRKR